MGGGPRSRRAVGVARPSRDLEAHELDRLKGRLVGDATAAVEWIKTSESAPPFDDSLPYVSPSGPWIGRAGATRGDVLDQLRELSAALAGRFGWHPALAALFVLTDETPPLVVRSTATTMRIADGGTEEWITVKARADDDPRAVGDSFARRRTVRRRQPVRDQERFAALRTFVDERRPPATWPQLVAEWNNRYPKWRYESHEKLRQAHKRTAAR